MGGNLSGLPVFPADNPWNQDISAAPVDPNSARLVASIGLTTSLHPDFGTYYNGAPWGISYVTVSGNQAKVPITYVDYPSESDPGPFPIPADAPIEGGPDGWGDRHVIVVDRDNAKLYELLRAFPTANGWNAMCGATFDLKSNALRPSGWTSADAAGLPIFPGLVRYEEAVEQGEIRHALRFTAMRTRREFVYPARHFASTSTDPSLPPMGARVRLKASVDISSYPPTAQVVLRALKRYGMILADNGGSWFVSGAPDPRWNDAEIDTLKRIKGSDFEVIQLGYPGAPTESVPAAPNNLRATGGILLANLSWSASTGATSYTVKRSTTSGSGYVTVADRLTGTSFTDVSLQAGTTYYYVVSATNGSGTSANSTPVAVTPLASTLPTLVAPTNLRVTVNSTYNYLTWTGSSGATTYSVKRSTTSGSGYVTIGSGITGTNHFDFAVTKGTTYYYVVTAVNAAGESPNSAQVTATSTSPVVTPPAAPANLQATAGNTQVGLSWSASSGATSYTVKRSTSSGTGYTAVASGLTGTSYTDTGLTNGATYYYVVTATNSGGTSGNSAQVAATPTAPTGSTLAAPTNLKATVTSYVYLTWNAVPGATTYTVKRSTTSGGGYTVIGKGLTGPNHFDFAVTKGTTYYYVVTAVNATGESAPSAEVSTGQSMTTYSLPAAPANLQATAGNAQVTLTWSGSTGATSYTVKRSTTSGSGYTAVASGRTGTSYTDTGLTNGTTYYYVVTASNTTGESAGSTQVAATPAAPSSGAGTTTLRINCGGSTYFSGGLTWSAEQYASGGAVYTYPGRDIRGTTEDSRYLNVRYSEGSNFTYTLPATAGNYTLKLHFAECWFTTAGNRIFNVKVNGNTLLSNFDIVAAGGANSAVVKSFPVTVGSSGLAVLFENVKNGPVVSAIELVPAP